MEKLNNLYGLLCQAPICQTAICNKIAEIMGYWRENSVSAVMSQLRKNKTKKTICITFGANIVIKENHFLQVCSVV